MFESREALSLGEGTTLPMWATFLPLEFRVNRAVINQKEKKEILRYEKHEHVHKHE